MNQKLLKMIEEDSTQVDGKEFRQRMHHVKTKQDKHDSDKHAKKLAYKNRHNVN